MPAVPPAPYEGPVPPFAPFPPSPPVKVLVPSLQEESPAEVPAFFTPPAPTTIVAEEMDATSINFLT